MTLTGLPSAVVYVLSMGFARSAGVMICCCMGGSAIIGCWRSNVVDSDDKGGTEELGSSAGD